MLVRDVRCDDTEDVYNIQGPNEEINMDDVNLDMEATSNFNKHTGLWIFKALSKHNPYANMMELNLVHHKQTRNDYVNSQNFDPDFGVYRNAHLKPQAQGVDCTCGAGYRNQDYQYKGVITLYTCNGPVELELYNLTCDVQECEVSFLQKAERRGISFYSNKTCAGDEIGWDFICLVKKSKMPFTGFCTEMSRHYQTNAMNSMKFMSSSTFVKWFFAWISTFQIDFRKKIDPWCEHSPRILACDGTHIGVATRKMNLAQPVTSADDIDCTSITKHKWYDRVFVTDTNARLHLNYICRKILKKLKPKEKLSEEQELCETQYTMNEVRKLGMIL